MIRFSRIVTIYDQWHFLDWLDDATLFNADTEFILVDDCSPQQPPEEILSKLATRGARLERPFRNSGRCIARNLGASVARGEYLDFIDGDDRPLPLCHEPAWAGAEVVFFPFRVHGQGHSMAASFARNPILRDERAPHGYLDIRPAAVLWKRAAFADLGGFDARFEGAEDLELALRAHTLNRGFATQPKQSYNEQPRQRFTEISYSATRLNIYRQRLPASDPLRQRLIEDNLHALHHHSTWALLSAGQHLKLFRASLALLKNLLLATISRKRRKQFEAR